MATFGTKHGPLQVSGLSSYSIDITIPANATVFVCFTTESATITFDTITFDGNAVTQLGDPLLLGNMQLWAGYIDTSLAAGTYTLAVTISAIQTLTYYVEPMTDVATGGPEADFTDTQNNTAAVVGDSQDLTVTEGALVIGVACNSSAGVALNSMADLTQEATLAVGWSTTQGIIDGATAGAVDCDCTYASNSADKLFYGASFADAAGGGPFVVVTALNDIQ